MEWISEPRPSEVIQVGSGAAWELREPHTVESIRADAKRAQGPQPFLCRWGLHRRTVVGEPYVPDDDLTTSVLNLVATMDKCALTRCDRCGTIAERAR